MKKLLLVTVLLCTASILTAGDAAVFADLGFSEDGSTYLFGQYGKKDISYEAWAELYAVNIEKNEYVKDEVFITKPGKDTVSLSGKKAFDALKEKATWKIAKYKCQKTPADTLLYLRPDESKKPEDEIVFKDFEASTEESSVYYHIKLTPYFEGKGKDIRSSYYIKLEKQNEKNELLFKKVIGNPDIKRKGISSYKIAKIFTDKTGKNLVFVIEKTLEDETGTSIRYMIETVKM